MMMSARPDGSKGKESPTSGRLAGVSAEAPVGGAPAAVVHQPWWGCRCGSIGSRKRQLDTIGGCLIREAEVLPDAPGPFHSGPNRRQQHVAGTEEVKMKGESAGTSEFPPPPPPGKLPDGDWWVSARAFSSNSLRGQGRQAIGGKQCPASES